MKIKCSTTFLLLSILICSITQYSLAKLSRNYNNDNYVHYSKFNEVVVLSDIVVFIESYPTVLYSNNKGLTIEAFFKNAISTSNSVNHSLGITKCYQVNAYTEDLFFSLNSMQHHIVIAPSLANKEVTISVLNLPNNIFSLTIQPVIVKKTDNSESEVRYVDNYDAIITKHIDATQKIFNQVGITMMWRKPEIYNNNILYDGLFNGDYDAQNEIIKTKYISGNDATKQGLYSKSDSEKVQYIKNNPINSKVLYAFLVKHIVTGSSVGGQSLLNNNIFFIADWSLNPNGNHLHLFSHEISHNLGIDHQGSKRSYGAGDSVLLNIGDNLMYGINPTSLDDIYPDGRKLAQLNPKQMAVMLNHTAVIEPETD